MATDPSALRALAHDLGVSTRYWGWDGTEKDVADSTLHAILAALGSPLASDEDIAAVRARRERAPWERTLPPVTVMREDRASSVPVHVDHGTPVTVHPARYGTSAPGIEDRPHLWPGGDYLGSASVTPHRQGAAAEYLVIERANLRVLPESLPLERGALAEPLAVSLHAVTIAGDVTGKDCLVLGAGPIGLLAVASLLHRGAASVHVTDVRPEPLERAAALGAQRTILVTEETPEANSYDVVLECSAAPVSLSSAVQAVRPAGIIVQVAILPDKDIPVNLAALVSKEVQLRGTQRFDIEIDEAITLLDGDARFDAVVTQTIPLEKAEEAFATARDASRSAKVLLAL